MEDSRYLVQDEALLKDTSSYPITDASIVLSPTATVPDILTGGQRKRKFAMVLSMAGLPGFQKLEDPVILSSSLPKVLIDGDSIEILRSRAHAELDAMFNVFEDSTNGTLDMTMPDEKEQVESGER